MLVQIVLLLASTLCDLLSVVLLIRFLLQARRAPAHVWRGPIGQFVLAATNWMVLPLRRVVPSAFGYDTSSLLLAWFWQSAFLGIATLLGGMAGGMSGGSLPLPAVILFGLLELAKMVLYLAMGVVIVAAIFSWVNPHAPAAEIFHELSRPLLRPFQRLLPALGGVDLSPLLLILVLQVLLIVLAGLRGSLLPLLYT